MKMSLESGIGLNPMTAGITSTPAYDPDLLLDTSETGSGTISVASDGLTATYTSPGTTDRGGMPADTVVTSGNWYWEIDLVSNDTPSGNFVVGLVAPDDTDWSAQLSNEEGVVRYSAEQGRVAYETSSGNVVVTGLPTAGAGDTIGVALNADTGAVWMSVNGVWVNGATEAEIAAGDDTNAVATSLGASGYVPFATGNSGHTGETHTVTYNFGDTSFAHSVPGGYEAYEEANDSVTPQPKAALEAPPGISSFTSMEDVSLDNMLLTNDGSSAFGGNDWTLGFNPLINNDFMATDPVDLFY